MINLVFLAPPPSFCLQYKRRTQVVPSEASLVCVCLEERRARLTVCGMTRLAAVGGGEFASHSLKFLYPLSASVHHHQPVWLLDRREGKREQGGSYTFTLQLVCILSLTHRWGRGERRR